MIQQIVNETNQILNSEQPTKRVLAVGIEINQLYLEYLEWLEEQDLSIENGVTVNVILWLARRIKAALE